MKIETVTTTVVKAVGDFKGAPTKEQRIFDGLTAAHADSGENVPLEYTHKDANEIGFAVQCELSTIDGLEVPAEIGYPTGKDSGWSNFNRQHNELKRLLQNLPSYTEGKALADDLKLNGIIKQVSGSPLLNCMEAVAEGTVAAHRTKLIANQKTAIKNAADKVELMKTAEGFDGALKTLKAKAKTLDITWNNEMGKFVDPAPIVETPTAKPVETPTAKPVETPTATPTVTPTATPEVLTIDSITDAMNRDPAYANYVQWKMSQ
jgi:hypothetical protein